MKYLPLQTLKLEFCECGRSNTFADNWKHVKTAPYTIIAQVLNGSYEISCNNQTEIIHEGEAFLTPANSEMAIIHHYGSRPDHFFMESQWLHFHFTVFNVIDVTSLFRLPLKLSSSHQHLIDHSIKEVLEMTNADSGYDLVNSIRINTILFNILDLIVSVAEPDDSAFQQFETSTRFTPVFDYMKKHLDASVKIEDLAKQAGMSQAHFHHVFKDSMGCSPMNYLKKVRLEQAGLRLLNSNDTLAEIADRTGFSNQFHLCREFTRQYGVAPSVYRKNNTWD